MDIISEYRQNEAINEFLDNNPSITTTNNVISEVKDTFNMLMKEERHQNKTSGEQRNFIQSLLEGRVSGTEDMQFQLNHWSDNQHMNYFDEFVESGQTSVIQEVLKNYNIPTSVLKGIKPLHGHDAVFDIDGHTVRVVQAIQEVDGESPELENFYIEYDGKKIYDYKQDTPIETKIVKDIGDIIDEFGEEDIESIPTKQTRKSGKPRKSVYIGEIHIGDRVITKEVASNERILYRDALGRFTRK